MLDIKLLSALPDVAERAPSTLYLIPEGQTGLRVYLTDKDNTVTRESSSRTETIALIAEYGQPITASVAPDPATAKSKFWLDDENLILYVLYDDGTTKAWVEAMSSVAIPEFAGTGSADTMARSDHNHDQTYAKILVVEW